MLAKLHDLRGQPLYVDPADVALVRVRPPESDDDFDKSTMVVLRNSSYFYVQESVAMVYGLLTC